MLDSKVLITLLLIYIYTICVKNFLFILGCLPNMYQELKNNINVDKTIEL